MTAFGSCFNAIYLLPKFSELYGIPLDAIIGMGTAINPAIHSISGLVLMCVVPLNLLKRRTGIADHYFGLQKAQPDLKGSA